MILLGQVTGKCGSVIVRLIPAPRGAGIVAARVPKKVLQMAGIEDVYTCSRGSTKTLGNFVKVCQTIFFLSNDFLSSVFQRNKVKIIFRLQQDCSSLAGLHGL